MQLELPTQKSGVIATKTAVAKPEHVTISIPWEVNKRYLEIREISTRKVVTVIEVPSPASKRAGEGCAKYLEKRQKVFGSAIHLIEIDLLRKGNPCQ